MSKPLGHYLRAGRIHARMTIAVAAGLAGVSRTHLTELESGKYGQGIQYRTLLALATAYGMTVSELTGEVPKKIRLNASEVRAVQAFLAVLRGRDQQGAT